MKEDVAKMWLTALRSGEYTQTVACLRDMKGMCGLGVLCDLYRKERGIDDYWKKDYKTQRFFHAEERPHTIRLPPNVIEWAGMHSSTGVVPPHKEFRWRSVR